MEQSINFATSDYKKVNIISSHANFYFSQPHALDCFRFRERSNKLVTTRE